MATNKSALELQFIVTGADIIKNVTKTLERVRKTVKGTTRMSLVLDSSGFKEVKNLAAITSKEIANISKQAKMTDGTLETTARRQRRRTRQMTEEHKRARREQMQALRQGAVGAVQRVPTPALSASERQHGIAHATKRQARALQAIDNFERTLGEAYGSDTQRAVRARETLGRRKYIEGIQKRLRIAGLHSESQRLSSAERDRFRNLEQRMKSLITTRPIPQQPTTTPRPTPIPRPAGDLIGQPFGMGAAAPVPPTSPLANIIKNFPAVAEQAKALGLTKGKGGPALRAQLQAFAAGELNATQMRTTIGQLYSRATKQTQTLRSEGKAIPRQLSAFTGSLDRLATDLPQRVRRPAIDPTAVPQRPVGATLRSVPAVAAAPVPAEQFLARQAAPGRLPTTPLSFVERIIRTRLRTLQPEFLKSVRAAEVFRVSEGMKDFLTPGGQASRIKQSFFNRAAMRSVTGTLGFGLGGFGGTGGPRPTAAAARQQVALGRLFDKFPALAAQAAPTDLGIAAGPSGARLRPRMEAMVAGEQTTGEMRQTVAEMQKLTALRAKGFKRQGLPASRQLTAYARSLTQMQGYINEIGEVSPRFTDRMRRTVREGRAKLSQAKRSFRGRMGAITEAQIIGGGGADKPIGGAAGGRSIASMMLGSTDPSRLGGVGSIFPGTGKRFRGFGTAVRTVAQFAGASAIIFAFTSAIRDAISAGQKFETTFARIQGVLPSRNIVERIEIEKAVIQAARDYSVDLLQAAESAKIFAQQGLRAAEITRELGAAMIAVQAIGLQPQQAREALTAVRKITTVQPESATVHERIFGRQVQSLEILDRISRVESRRAINASDLADALKQAAPLARQLRGQFVGIVDELDIVQGAATQIVEQTRVSGRQAATSLRFILARLGRPQVLRQVEQIGGVRLATAESGGKQLRPLIQVLEELSDAYARIKREQGSAEAIKFLVAVAGARQINAAAILLSSYKDTLAVARLGALAWGDTQERLAIQQKTFESALTRMRTEMRAFGTGMVQNSGTALVLRTAIAGVTKGLQSFGGAAEFSELKVAGLIAAFVIAFKAVRALRIGLLALATTPFIAAGATAIIGFFTTTAGAIVAVTAALTALTVAAKIFGREKGAFAIDFIEPGEINLAEIPKAQQFIDLAKSMDDIPVDELFQAFIQGSHSALKFLEEQGLALVDVEDKTGKLRSAADRLALASDRDFKIVRDNVRGLSKTIVDDLFAGFETTAPKFVEFINKIIIDKGLDEMAASALRLQGVMTLLSDVSFISLSVLGQNLQRIATQTDNLIAQLNDGIRVASTVQAKLLRAPIQVPGIGTSLGGTPVQIDVDLTARKIQEARAKGGFDQILKSFRGPVIKQVRELFGGLNKGLQDLIVSFIDSETTADAFAAALSSIAEAGEDITLENFLARYNRNLQILIADESRRAEVVSNIAEQMTTIFAAQDVEAGVRPLTDMFELPVDAVQSFATTVIPLLKEAKALIIENLGGLDTAPKDVLAALELAFDATKVAVTDMARALARVSDPLNKLLLGFYAQERAIDANAAAAQRLGLASTEALDRLKNAQKFGQQLFAIEEQFTTRILQKGLQILETTPSGVSQKSIEAAEALTAAGIQGDIVAALIQSGIGSTAQVEKAATSVFVLAQRLKVLGDETTDIFAIFDPGKIPDAAEALTKFIGFYNELLGITEEFTEEQLVADPSILLRAIAAGERSLEALKLAWDEVVKSVLKGMRIWEAQGARIQLIRDVTLEQIKLERQLNDMRSKSLQAVATFGLRPLEKMGIEQGIQLEQEAERFRLVKAEIEARRIFNQLEFDGHRRKEAAYDKENIQLDTRLIREGQITELNRQRILEETTIRAIQQAQLDALARVQSNYDERIAGIKQILTDFETISSGKFFEAFFGVPGKAFVNRQADILIEELFDPTRGLFKNIGVELGLAGETDQIVVAHTTGSAIAAAAIVQAHIYGGAVAASLLRGESPAQAAKQGVQAVKAFATPEEIKASQEQALLQGLGTAAGNLGGAAIGGGGEGAQIGASFGTLGGTLIGAKLGALGGPIGAVIGGVLGGVIGGLFDKEEQQFQALQVIARNTGESVTLLENTNRLLDPNQVSFALPTSFKLPGFAPSTFGGQTSINNQINVNVAPGTSAEQGREIATVISQELDRQLNSGGLYVTKVGY